MKRSLYLCASALVMAPTHSQIVAKPSAKSAERPNVILFLVDDMGLMDTSLPFLTNSQGEAVTHPLNEWYRTPNMERLAEQGVRFSTFYANSVSSPSRVSIMTGQSSARHRTTQWILSESNNMGPYGPAEWNWEGIGASTPTLPSLLQQNGYRTIHVGKAHFGCDGSFAEAVTTIGFDVNIAGSTIGQPGSYYGEDGYGHIKGNKARAVPGLEKYHGSETFLSDALTFEANEQIESAVEAGEPFFLYLAHYAVHSPYMADKRFSDNYKDDSYPAREQAFATLIEGMDLSLGMVMDKLQELDIAENTLILFVGDNGSAAPIGDAHSYSSSAPLRGMKGTRYEGGMRVPFIAAWAEPNSKSKVQRALPIAQGSIQSQMGTIMDLYPTILSMLDIELPAAHTVDGDDLKKQFTAKYNKQREDKFLMHFPHSHTSSYFTVYINGDWKLIYGYNPESPAEPQYELFNLDVDPYEASNLAESNPEKLRSMVEEMIAELDQSAALYPHDGNGKELRPILP